jgi:hypothetical protein
MGQRFLEERRHNVRYDVTLSAKIIHGLTGEELIINSHDISSNGVGIIVDRPLILGEIIDITFIMPDNAEQVETRGMVIWMGSKEQERFRAGVAITDQELRPIPMVLRSIKVRTNRYSC